MSPKALYNVSDCGLHDRPFFPLALYGVLNTVPQDLKSSLDPSAVSVSPQPLHKISVIKSDDLKYSRKSIENLCSSPEQDNETLLIRKM